MRRVLLPPGLFGPPPRPRWRTPTATLGGPTMGVSWTVKLQPPPGADPEAIGGAVQALLDRLVMQVSAWEPASDLSRFNRAPPGEWAPLPPEMLTVVRAALHWAERTGGAYDPTLGRLVDLWGFGPVRDIAGPPDEAALAAARADAGWRRLELDVAGARLRQPGGLALDLSGIAKGYAVDAVSRALHALDAPDHLVDIGGELVGSGVKADGQPWWVELEAPPGLTLSDPPIIAALHGLAVATSGGYRQTRTLADRTIHHTLDARTGRPADTDLVAVTVLAPDAMTADALATALLVMDAGRALTWAETETVAARLLTPNGEHLTSALSAML